MPERVVVDASTMVELLVSGSGAADVIEALRGRELAAPAHFDAEVLSGLGRLWRSEHMTASQVSTRLERLEQAPISRLPLAPLLKGAWARRHNLRLADALYVELAERLDTQVLTVDRGMAAATPVAHLVGG